MSIATSLHVDGRLLHDDGLPRESQRGGRGRGRDDGGADGAGGRGHEGDGGAPRGDDRVGQHELGFRVRLGLGPTSAQKQEEEWQ